MNLPWRSTATQARLYARWLAGVPDDIERLEVVRLLPGDTIVATLPDDTDPRAQRDIRETLQVEFPDHQVIVKSRSIDLEVVRPEEEAT